MRNVTRSLALLFALALPGCYTQELQPTPSDDAPRNEPKRTVAELKAHGTDDGDVLLADLTAAHGLETKLDKVTGRRVLTDRAGNTAIVIPGNHSVVLNGTEYPLHGEVRWKHGQIYLPGEARVIFGDHLKRRGVPEVGNGDRMFAYLDSLDENAYLVPSWSKRARPATTKAPAPRGFSIDPHAPSLPAGWNMNARRQWTWIVIHHSATGEGSATSFGRAHQKKWENGLGYHFVIGNGSETKDGEIEVGPRWFRQNQGIDGAHAGVEKYNKHGIGICLVGDFDKGQPTPKQLAALKNLCEHLMQRYGIGKDHILPHRAVKTGHTECPGTAFPLEPFIRSL